MSAIITNRQISKFYPFVFQNNNGDCLAIDNKGKWWLDTSDDKEVEVFDDHTIVQFLKDLAKEATEAFNKQNK